MTGRERRYSVPAIAQLQSSSTPTAYGDNSNNSRANNTAEDLHAWSIYRQNLNSDFADSALGSNMKAPLPYGNFQLDSTTSTYHIIYLRNSQIFVLFSLNWIYLKKSTSFLVANSIDVQNNSLFPKISLPIPRKLHQKRTQIYLLWIMTSSSQKKKKL